MANSLKFKVSGDDTEFHAMLRRMEYENRRATQVMTQDLKNVGKHAGGLARPVGDILDGITGQQGYVMKLSALTHGLGVSLGGAVGGLLGAGLAYKLYESADAADTLRKKIDGLKESAMSAPASSASMLTESLKTAQGLKAEALESIGANLSLQEIQNPKATTKFKAFAKSLQNTAMDAFEGLFSSDARFGDTQNKASDEGKRALEIQQSAVDKLAEKTMTLVHTKQMLANGDAKGAALQNEEVRSMERMGELARQSREYGVDNTRQVEAELALNKQNTAEIQKQYQYLNLATELRNNKATSDSSSRGVAMTSATVESQTNELTKRFSRAQETNFLRNRIRDAQGYLGGTMQGPAGDERRAELQKSIAGDRAKIRDLAVGYEMLTPQQRIQEHRDALRMKHAEDRADRKDMIGMTKDQKEAFMKEKNAARDAAKKGGNTSKIDDGSITKLAEAVKTAVKTLIMQ